MIDLLYHLFPQLPPQDRPLLEAILRAFAEWLFFAFFALGVTAFVRVLIHIGGRR